MAVDWAASPGDSVHAVAGGKVVRVGDFGDTWDGYIVVQHQVGNYTFTVTYGHVDKDRLPQVGQEFEWGERIGWVGSVTEDGEVHHLHMSMHEGSYRPNRQGSLPNSHGGAAKLADNYVSFFNPANPRLYGRRQ